MTIAELKQLIDGIPDHFIFEVEVEKEIPEEELEKMEWKYPIASERYQTSNKNYDIGWSEQKIKINVRITDI